METSRAGAGCRGGAPRGAVGSVRQERFAFVDALRGLAALSVVVFHVAAGGHIPELLAALPSWLVAGIKRGDQGVAVFFVLSGFVIAHSVYAERITLPFVARFMLRRSVRLDPPYWMAIVVALGFAALSARLLPGKAAPDVSFPQLFAHLFYVQEVLGYPPINLIFWTLCLEVQFYLVYVLMLAMARNDPSAPLQGRRVMIALAGAALVSLAWPLAFSRGGPGPGRFLPLWHGFLRGVLAYWAWRNTKLRAFFLGFALVIAIAAAMRGNAFSLVCVAAALALWVVAISNRVTSALNWSWLQLVGALSYSLYLTHAPIIGASFRVGYMLTGESRAWEIVWTVVTLGACLAFAWVVWRLVEKASIRWARAIPLRSPEASPLRSLLAHLGPRHGWAALR